MDKSSTSEVVGYLKSIAQHTEPKPSYYVTVSGKESRIHTNFNPPLNFPGCQYEIALCGIETYYSFPNIDNTNNKICVSITNKKKRDWHTLEIPTGCYEIATINSTLKRLLKEVTKTERDDYICITANRNTLRCVLTIANDVWVDFKSEHGTLRKVLGFEQEVYQSGRYESPHPVNIMRINSIFVHCDIVKLSRNNGIESPIVYTFFPNVSPGQKIVNRPRNLIYLPLTLSVISQMTVWLTDQYDKPLNNRNEEITVTFHIRSC